MTCEVLSDVHVVDFSRLAPGPMATTILADLGAHVLKVEEPHGGQRARDERVLRGHSAESYPLDEARRREFLPLERGKRSIAVDLKSTEGLDIARRLVARTDVVVEGFRPGVMDRLGLGYEALSAQNPRLVYCSISGYGQSGPRALSTGHDLNYLADAGALSLIGTTDGTPVVPINVIADYSAGSLRAAMGVLAALYVRRKNGLGQRVDVSMTDGVLGLLGVEVAEMLLSGPAPQAGQTRLTGGVAHYNVYSTRDRRHITICCNEPHFYQALCELLGVPEIADEQFAATDRQRQIRDVLAARFVERDLAEWQPLLAEANVPYAVARTLDEVIDDPHYRSRNMIVDVATADGRAVPQIGALVPLGSTPAVPQHAAVRPGTDTREVLADLGFATDVIKSLYSRNVVA